MNRTISLTSGQDMTPERQGSRYQGLILNGSDEIEYRSRRKESVTVEDKCWVEGQLSNGFT